MRLVIAEKKSVATAIAQALCAAPVQKEILTYPNGDVCCYTGIVFYTTQFMGELLQETNETWEHRFFAKSEIPDTVTSYDRRMVDRWISGEKELVII